MKRSEINKAIKDAMAYLESLHVKLPPFAYLKADEWSKKGSEYDEIRENMLGWDVTDYGKGDFKKLGLLLFTIRNGNLKKPQYYKPYAEKMLLLNVGQVSPNHFHYSKMEDIINKNGGILCMQLWNSTDDNQLADSDVTVRVDGCLRTLPAGGILRLTPGESVTLPPRMYHKFWVEEERCLIWEVSMLNDDTTDNHFYEPQERFTSIDEDEAAEYLLCAEYPTAVSDN